MHLSTSWNRSVIALAIAGVLLVSAMPAAASAISLTQTLVYSGDYGRCDMALDASGTPHLIYDINDKLYYVTSAEGGWTSRQAVMDVPNYGTATHDIAVNDAGVAYVLSDYSVYMSFGIACMTNQSGKWKGIFGAEPGFCGAVAIAPDGTPWAVYRQGWTETYVGSYTAAGGFKTELVEAVPEWDSDIKVDSSGNVHAVYSYVDGQKTTSSYATNRSGSWSYEKECDTARVRLAVTGAGVPVTAAVMPDGWLCFGERTDAGWVQTQVAYVPKNGQCDIAVDDSGAAWIAYSEAHMGVWLATNRSGSFESYKIFDAGNTGEPVIEIRGNTLAVMVDDYDACSLWYFEGTIPEPSTMLLLAAGGLALLRRK